MASDDDRWSTRRWPTRARSVNRPQTMTVSHAAAYIDVSERTIWRLIRAEKIGTRHIGGRTLVLVRDLDALVEGGSE